VRLLSYSNLAAKHTKNSFPSPLRVGFLRATAASPAGRHSAYRNTATAAGRMPTLVRTRIYSLAAARLTSALPVVNDTARNGGCLQATYPL